jgi:hypothetical protein
VAPFLVQQSPWADFLCSESATMLHLQRYLNSKLHVRDIQMSLSRSCVARILTGGLYVADDITYKAPGGVLS